MYNFTSMKRMSYYPHNQPIVAVGTESDNTDRTMAPSVTGSIIPTATIVERSLAGSPSMFESTNHHHHPPIPVATHGYAVS